MKTTLVPTNKAVVSAEVKTPSQAAVPAGVAKSPPAAAPVSSFQANLGANVATVPAPTAPLVTSAGLGWTPVSSTEPGGAVRAAQAELRQYARLALQGGLRPALIRVAPAEAGVVDSEWFTSKGADGQPQVAWVVRTPDGVTPKGLEALAGELGVKDLQALAVAPLEQPTPITPVTDVSAKASFGRAMKLADQLFRAAGGNPEAPEYQLFRYTVARYALNATSPQALAYLADHYRGDSKGLIATGQVPARWVEKLDRSFSELYTNDAALEWLRETSKLIPAATAFIDEANVNDAPITFYTAGSTTKARWTAQSDLDLLIDTPDKELEQKILKGPHGFHGGANKDVFAILNASFYWDRGPFFGQPVELAKGTAAMKPEVVEATFVRTARENYGVELTATKGGTRVTLLPTAADAFVRESPTVSEVLYDYSRPTRAQLDTKWVTEHWDAIVKQGPELQYLSRQRLIDEGNALVDALLPAALAHENVSRFFKAAGLPLPATPDDLVKALPAMRMDELLGLTDPAERLFVDFAASEQVKAAAEGKVASPWADAFAEARAASR